MKKLRVKTHRDGSRSWWFDHGGKPRRWEPLGKNEPKALERYHALISAPKPAPGSVDQMLAEYIESMRGKVAVATMHNWKSQRKHIGAVFHDPERITQADVLRYL